MAKVWRAATSCGSSDLMIHRDRGCYRLKSANNVLAKDDSIYPDWIDQCPNCWGDVDG